MKLFLSGPFFNEEEVERLDRVKGALEAEGFEVYSTYHRNARINLDSAREKNRRFKLLCREIGKSDGVFAVLDSKDAGTIWEMGYAYALDKPVIAFCEGDPFFSLMIDGSAACLTGLDSIDGKISGYLKKGNGGPRPGFATGKKCDY